MTMSPVVQKRYDPFHIPQSMSPAGMSYQWVDPHESRYAEMSKTGWHPVPFEWHDDFFKPHDNADGFVKIGGQVLVCRPQRMTDAAQAENVRKAAKQIDDWAARFGDLSGSVRIQGQMNTGIGKVYERPIGDPQIATRLAAFATPNQSVSPSLPSPKRRWFARFLGKEK